jgi:hypothetical protein
MSIVRHEYQIQTLLQSLLLHFQSFERKYNQISNSYFQVLYNVLYSFANFQK